MLGSEIPRLNNKKNKATVTTASLFILVTFVVAGIATTTPLALPYLQSAEAYINPNNLRSEPKAPSVISGENVYVVWWTDKGTPNTNGEVMFRASTDGDATYQL